MSRPGVHGHRGARAILPENTIPAFEYAIALGVDAIEMDVHVAKDGVVVVSHDPWLGPPVCTGARGTAFIHELTFQETQLWDCGSAHLPAFPRQQKRPGTRIPSLEQVLALKDKGRFLFNIELKSVPEWQRLTPPPDEFARIVLDVISRAGAERRVMLQSFDWRVTRALATQAPSIPRLALTEDDPRDFAAIAAEARAQSCAPRYTLVTREKTQRAREAGVAVVPWTPNREAEWSRMIDAEVDAIITDDPAALIAYLKQRDLPTQPATRP
jgi:glycerophosphoryl diester phosphodiesterase